MKFGTSGFGHIKRVATGVGVAQRVVLAVLVASSLAATDLGAQQRELSADWNDISATVPSIDELAVIASRATPSDAFWVGYTFALRDGVHVGCDERSGRSFRIGSDEVNIYIERPGEGADDRTCDDEIGLFLRFEEGPSEVVQARLMTLRRAASRLGEPVAWGGEIAADASVSYLRAAILGGTAAPVRTNSQRVRERLLSAVAVHRSDAAVDVVFAALENSRPTELRESAVFWVSQIGGDAGLERLIDLARRDSETEIRKQSIFWLGQAAGERATEHLAEIAADDPDTEVRQSAVFALSQSEDGEAVDALIRIVRAHDNREVVKSALFWLGQSGDPRALEFFEELLFGRRD